MMQKECFFCYYFTFFFVDAWHRDGLQSCCTPPLSVTMLVVCHVQCKSKLAQFKQEQAAAKDEDLDMFGD